MKSKPLENGALEEIIQCEVACIAAWGIVETLRAGVDIIVCGRVTDANPIVAASSSR